MGAYILFRTHDIQVTPTVARFGPVSYQVRAISSVAVYHRPKLNPVAVTLVLAAAGLGLFAYFAREQYPDYSLWSAIAAPVALILGVFWQRIRPVLEYQFVMKTTASETETITTFDREQVFELREAIERAFLMQRALVEPITTAPLDAPVETPPPSDRPPEDFQITRDWVVAHSDPAAR
jgi:Family of unknown function (DUF6232)